MKKTKRSIKKEIAYHVVNALIAGLLIFLGSLTTGKITLEGVFYSIVTAAIVALAKFKEFWDGEESKFKVFHFIG
jgi:hypothetical protein